MLVSRRWQRLFFSEPQLWHSMVVLVANEEPGPQLSRRLEMQAGLLRRVAPLVHCFSWSVLLGATAAATESRLADCLSALEPGRLAELHLECSISSAETTGGGWPASQPCTLNHPTTVSLRACWQRWAATCAACSCA